MDEQEKQEFKKKKKRKILGSKTFTNNKIMLK